MRRLLLSALVFAVAFGAAVRVTRRSNTFPPRPLPLVHPELVIHLFEGLDANDEFGNALAGVGDVNGDGCADVAIGALYDTSPEPEAGRLRVFSGKDGAVLLDLPGAGGWLLGCDVAAAGDLDRTGAPYVAIGLTGSRIVNVVDARTGANRLTAAAPGASEFGFSIAPCGDVNGDGTPDLVIGAPGTWLNDAAGVVHVVSGTDGSTIHTLRGPGVKGDRFGFAVSGAGDLDGDGTHDLLIGCLGENEHAGAVHVISGRTGAEIRRLHGDGAGDELGHDVAAMGDLDGDGVPEVAAGAFHHHGRGYARIYSGRTGDVLHQFDALQADDAFAHSIANIGDADGDGLDDLVVGAPNAEIAGVRRVGYVRVFSGRTGDVLLHFAGDRERGKLGYVVETAGDVDGDGRPDVLAGTSISDGHAGRAFVLRVPID